MGIEPIVYAPSNPSYPILDESLEKEVPEGLIVLKHKIFEPNQWLGNRNKKESGGFLKNKPGLLVRFMYYVRANFFVPDARKFWIKPSVQFLTHYLKEHPVDAIITTGPPHSMHLIGLALREKNLAKWIADFRDPWTAIDYFHQLPLTKAAKEKHFELEKKVVTGADVVVVVGNSMKQGFQGLNSNVQVITNGFDELPTPTEVALDARFSLVHIGLMNDDRNPTILWQALLELLDEHPELQHDLQIRLIGKISASVQDALSQFDASVVKHISYLSHDEVRAEQLSAQVLVLAINKVPTAKGIVTGKIFEYLQAKRPILGIGPRDGDAAEILKDTRAGICFDFDQKDAIKNHILALYKEYKRGRLSVQTTHIKQYHRKELTKVLVNIIRETTANS